MCLALYYYESGKEKTCYYRRWGCWLFTAANVDGEKYDIHILEQASDVLQKVKISGGGRCNVTHACFDPRELTSFTQEEIRNY